MLGGISCDGHKVVVFSHYKAYTSGPYKTLQWVGVWVINICVHQHFIFTTKKMCS